MPIAPSLQRFVEDELLRSVDLFDRIAAGTLELLRHPRDKGLSVHERHHFHELADLLGSRQPDFARSAAQALRQLVLADVNERDTHLSNDPLGDVAGALTLMDETRVEADIEISRAAQVLDSAAEWELRELQTFTSTLNGQQHVSPDTNPLKPLSYARALWDAASALTPTFVQRSLLLRLAAGVASGLLKRAWAAASSRLEDQGVQPGVYRTVVLAPSAVPERTALMSPAMAAGQMPAVGVGSLMAGTHRAAAANADPRAAGAGADPQLEQALQQLDAMLSQLPPLPLAAPQGHRAPAVAAPRLRDHQTALVSSAPDAVDRQIIELLSRLFDMVLSDVRLPAAFRTLIARLQASALRVALNDPGMMQNHDHPVWQLMDRIGEASALYTQAGDPRLSGLLEFCEALVQDMARSRAPDAALYRESLARLDGHLQARLDEQLAQAQAKLHTLSQSEQRDQLQRQISQRLADQLGTLRAPVSPGIRRFITSVWSQVLAVAMLEDGETAASSTGYLQALDDLLWSLQPPDQPQSRQRLLSLLPPLLQRLREGMARVELPAVEQQHVLDELMAVHAEALRPGQRGSESADDIVRKMREETVQDTAPAAPFADSLIDLASMETVPAELIDDHPGDTAEAVNRVDAMRAGRSHRLFLRGRWTRALLLWRSPGGHYFLFASESPGRTHAVTRAALERLDAEKLLLPLEDRSLTQRAVEALMHEMDLPN